MELQNAKGTRDFLPEEKIARQRIMEQLKEVFELYGFSPLETPALELYEILASKYAGGASILEETFKLKDRGGRELALRYDLTVPFSRVVGMNPQLKMPFKRYQMDKVWRDGPTGLGRYREFWQCDVDVVGSKSMMADAEIISIAENVFEKFGLKVEILINSRKILNGILDIIGIKGDKEAIIMAVDKLRKTGREGVKEELGQLGLSDFTAESILDSFEMQGSTEEIFGKLKAMIKTQEGLDGIKELEEMFEYLKLLGVKSAKLDISLARGLVFYTGPVFETYLLESPIKSAVASGGRYDKIIGKFLESEEEYPATGISFGLDRIYDALKAEDKLEMRKTVSEAFVIAIGEKSYASSLSSELRKAGVKTETDIVRKSVTKNLEYVNSKGIPFVIFIGPNEVKEGKVKLRNMGSGEESMITVAEASRMILACRKQ